MLVIGVLAGWLLKPSAATAEPSVPAVVERPEPPAAPVASATDVEPVRSKRADREQAPPNLPAGVTEEQMAQATKMQGEMAKAMAARQRAKFEQQIERLAQDLDLTDKQKADLTGWLDAEMKKLEELDFTDMASMSKLEGLVTEKALQDQLMPSLTDEQATALTAFKEREHRGKVDSMALKNLSQLQGVIEFEEGQRDKVYEVLAETADEKLRAEEATPDFSQMFTEGMGIEMDPYDLGIQQALTESIGTTGPALEGNGQAGLAKKMREVIDQRIEAKVEKLRPVLNDRQMDQYRAELKSKGLGIYGTVLMGMESGMPQ